MKNNKINKFSFNTFKNKNRNINSAIRRNKKNLELYKGSRYLSTSQILKEVEKSEEKLKNERTEFIGKELITLYKKMVLKKKEIRKILGKYDLYDFSLNYFDLNKKKIFPKDYGKSIYSKNKY